MAETLNELPLDLLSGTLPSSPTTQSPTESPQSVTKRPRPKTIAPSVTLAMPVKPHKSNPSMSSIALSEASSDYDQSSSKQACDMLATPKRRHHTRHMRKPSSLEIVQNVWAGPQRQSTLFDVSNDQPPETPVDGLEDVDMGGWRRSPDKVTVEFVSRLSASTTSIPSVMHTRSSTAESRSSSNYSQPTPRRTSASSGEVELDWSQLDRHEEQEKEDKDLSPGAEDESTAFLLARLEQENAKFSSDPKSSATEKDVHRVRRQSRPLSMGHLKKLVSDRNAPSVRYSLGADMALPEEAPPMTELEFWAALVQDYPSTALRLPSLTTMKIRSGIPPPLRGIVWTSMSGARDQALEKAFDKLVSETSPYEGIINKDVGRSFPGVELFRDAEGEGQRMLGRVLKCYSLHDNEIGYCQGLGFLVGPLLMNMGEREAFCVLVRLMEHYSLRPSFLPSLRGLHMRIYQFSILLKQHYPELAEHLAGMGVEAAYISQWFLSCFAVTCPLPMLFRIYDVIFAEGANETVMRVALALVRRNEEKMLSTLEFEDVMQLLLGRGIWDSYACNADELVDDFTSLGDIVTHARLAELEKDFENQSSESIGQSAGFLPDVQAAASKFLGRLWASGSGHAHTLSKAASLSPHTAEKDGHSGSTRAGSFLRRSASKQSFGTANESMGSDSSTSSTASSAETAPTEPDAARESTADTMSLKSKPESVYPQIPSVSKEERDMHGQIEDLLTALSETQREHQQLAAILQREREERGEDQRYVRQLVGRLRQDMKGEVLDAKRDAGRRSMPPQARQQPANEEEELAKQRPKSMMLRTTPAWKEEGIDELVDKVSSRLDTTARFSVSFETRAQLRSNLARTREELNTAERQSLDLSARLEIAETNLAAFTSESEDLRMEVKELRVRVNEEYKAKQKMEHHLREFKAKARSVECKDRETVKRSESTNDTPTLWKLESASLGRQDSTSSVPASVPAPSGLRELRLGRQDSTGAAQSVRALRRQTVGAQISREKPVINIQTSPLSPTTVRFEAGLEAEAILLPSLSPPDSAMSAIEAPSPALLLPAASSFAARTSSLATSEVFATSEHEAVPEEALLLELVNAKTAEAQARQEMEELRRNVTLSHRRHEAALQQLQAQMAASRAETAQALAEAAAARLEVANVKVEAAASLSAAYGSVPTTPAAYDLDARSFGENSEMATPVLEHRAEGSGNVDSFPADGMTRTVSPPVGGGAAGWFWAKRSASGH